MRRKAGVFLVMMLVIPALIFAVGCAKKQVKSDEPVPGLSEPGAGAREGLSAEEEARRRAIEEQRLMDEQRRQREMAEREARSAFVNEDVYFDFDDYSLRSDAQAILREKADFLRDNPGVYVVIEGHCDERGTSEYNMALGERRAESAKSFLTNLGISGSRLTTVSWGEERPAVMGHDEDAWAKNRRAHFVIK